MIATAGALGLAGCAMGPVVYRPNAALTQKPSFPLRVSVPPFLDATQEDPTRSKVLSIPLVVLNNRQWVNVTRSYGKSSAYFSTTSWGKALASELQSSGLFKEVRYDAEESAPGTDIIIEGTVTRSTLFSQTVGIIFAIVYVGGRQYFAFTLKARRPGESKAFWEWTFERSVKGGNGEARLTAILRGMMSEGVHALVQGLEANRAAWTGAPPAAAPAAPGTSVDDNLRSLR